MTRVGVLGPPTRAGDLDSLATWADVLWGVDSVGDALRRAVSDPVDVLLTEASVAYLTEELLGLHPMVVGRIVAIADTDGVADWANSLTGVVAVRHIMETSTVVDSRDVVGTPTPTVTAVTEPGVLDTAGRVVAVWSPVGAPGASTTAISLATVSALGGLSTLLCDVDTRGASLAIALGLRDETPGFAAACRLAGRSELTQDEIRRVASTMERDGVRFDVLTGLPRASRWAEVAPTKARTVVDMVRKMYDVVILDVGFGIEENEWIDDAPQRDGTARSLVRIADSVVAVGSGEAVGLSRVIRGLDELRDICPDPIVVLNRVARGEANDAMDAIHRFTHHRVRVTVPADSRHGVEEAFERARRTPGPWRDISRHAGITLRAPRASRWRR